MVKSPFGSNFDWPARGATMMLTDFVRVQPAAMATVAFRVIGVPVTPAVKLTVVPVLLPLIVPFVIDHWKDVAPKLVMEALPAVAVVTAAGAEIVTSGMF